jgi:hypothetical protein
MGYALFSRKKNCHAKWGPALRREWIFQLSCAAFTFGGIWACLHTDAVIAWLATPTGAWPYFSRTFYYGQGVVLIAQGLLSFASDVIYEDVRSIVHPMDRVMAIVLTAAGAYTEMNIMLYGHLPVWLRVAMGTVLVLGLGCHLRAKYAIVHHDYAGYVRYHTLWHFAILSSMILPMHVSIFYLPA